MVAAHQHYAVQIDSAHEEGLRRATESGTLAISVAQVQMPTHGRLEYH